MITTWHCSIVLIHSRVNNLLISILVYSLMIMTNALTVFHFALFGALDELAKTVVYIYIHNICMCECMSVCVRVSVSESL